MKWGLRRRIADQGHGDDQGNGAEERGKGHGGYEGGYRHCASFELNNDQDSLGKNEKVLTCGVLGLEMRSIGKSGIGGRGCY